MNNGENNVNQNNNLNNNSNTNINSVPNVNNVPSTSFNTGSNESQSVNVVTGTPVNQTTNQNVQVSPTVEPTIVETSNLDTRSFGNGGIVSSQPSSEAFSQPVSQATIPQNLNTNSENIMNTQSSIDNDPGSVVNEKLKEVEIDYKPPSKFKTIMTVVMFILLIAFVIFLPDITSMVNRYKLEKNQVPEKIITTGNLECSLKSNTTNLDMEYLRVFKFIDSKLYEANYTLTTKGDATLDEKTLDGMAEKCNHLADNTEGLSGIKISCNYSDGKLVERQNYIFASINFNKLDAAFAEAGGTYPEFNDGQEIETVEKAMKAAGYSCERKE